MNTSLSTLAQAIEEVKRQDWGHRYRVTEVNRLRCELCNHEEWSGIRNACPVLLARAQQAAVAKALRWAIDLALDANGQAIWYKRVKEAADAIEKELAAAS